MYSKAKLKEFEMSESIILDTVRSFLGNIGVEERTERSNPTRSLSRDYNPSSPDFIEKVLCLYTDGMPTDDISAFCGVTSEEVDDVLDRYTKHL